MEQVISYLGFKSDTPSVLLVGIALGVFLLLSAFPFTWHIYRTWVTFVHETGHSLAATFTGGKPTSVVVNRDTSGLTQYLHTGFLPARILTTMAGYIAPAAVGLLLAWITSTGRINLTVCVTLALFIGSMLLYRIDFRSAIGGQLYGLVAVLAVAAWIGLMFWAPDPYKGYMTTLMTWSLLIGGFRPIVESRSIRLATPEPAGSDQEQLQEMTHLPAAFWEALFMVISVLCLVTASYLQFGIVGMIVIPVSVVVIQVVVVSLRSVQSTRSAVRPNFR